MSFKFSGIEVSSLTPENLERVCDAAERFDIGAVAHMTGEWEQHQLLDHTEWGAPPADEAARRYMIALQGHVRRASEYVASRGLDFYIWRRELRLPVGFIEKYGAAWVDFANPEVWNLVRWNLNQLFDLFPKVTGLVLTCTGEQKPGEWITADGVAGDLPLTDRFEKMFRTVKEACDRRGKASIFRNHGVGALGPRLDGGEYMRAFLEAVDRVGDGITLMGKGVEPDFQPRFPFNLVLSTMAAHAPTIMELSLPMEYNGVSRVPFPMVEDIEYRLRCARETGLHGVMARFDWHMSGHQVERTWSALGTLNEVNAYAFGRLIHEPGSTAETILADWCRERFDATAAPVAERIYANLYLAGCLNQYELGQRGCATPAGNPMPPASILAFARYCPLHHWTFSPYEFSITRKSLRPDDTLMAMIDDEKARAQAIYEEALRTLETNRGVFAPEDAAAIEAGLRRVLRELEIRRKYAGAAYRWLAFEQDGQDAWRVQAEALLAECDPLVAAYRADHDAHELDPDQVDGHCFGRRTHNAIAALRQELADSAQYWRGRGDVPDNSVQPSKEWKDTVVFAGQNVAIAIDPLALRVRSFKVRGEERLGEAMPLISVKTGGLDIGPGHFRFLHHRIYRQDARRLTLELRYGYAGLVLAVDLDDTAAAVNLRIQRADLPAHAVVALAELPGALREEGPAATLAGRRA